MPRQPTLLLSALLCRCDNLLLLSSCAAAAGLTARLSLVVLDIRRLCCRTGKECLGTHSVPSGCCCQHLPAASPKYAAMNAVPDHRRSMQLRCRAPSGTWRMGCRLQQRTLRMLHGVRPAWSTRCAHSRQNEEGGVEKKVRAETEDGREGGRDGGREGKRETGRERERERERERAQSAAGALCWLTSRCTASTSQGSASDDPAPSRIQCACVARNQSHSRIGYD